MRAGAAFTSRLAEGSVRTLDYMSTVRVIWCPEAGNTVEIIAEIGWRVGDKIAWVEVVTPRVPIHGIA
jgi:hypothetical protein